MNYSVFNLRKEHDTQCNSVANAYHFVSEPYGTEEEDISRFDNWARKKKRQTCWSLKGFQKAKEVSAVCSWLS